MANEIDYKKLSTELEEILDKLQGGEVDIDEAIKLHDKGQKIVADLQKYLKIAENKITKTTIAKK